MAAEQKTMQPAEGQEEKRSNEPSRKHERSEDEDALSRDEYRSRQIPKLEVPVAPRAPPPSAPVQRKPCFEAHQDFYGDLPAVKQELSRIRLNINSQTTADINSALAAATRSAIDGTIKLLDDIPTQSIGKRIVLVILALLVDGEYHSHRMSKLSDALSTSSTQHVEEFLGDLGKSLKPESVTYFDLAVNMGYYCAAGFEVAIVVTPKTPPTSAPVERKRCFDAPLHFIGDLPFVKQELSRIRSNTASQTTADINSALAAATRSAIDGTIKLLDDIPTQSIGKRIVLVILALLVDGEYHSHRMSKLSEALSTSSIQHAEEFLKDLGKSLNPESLIFFSQTGKGYYDAEKFEATIKRKVIPKEIDLDLLASAVNNHDMPVATPLVDRDTNVVQLTTILSTPVAKPLLISLFSMRGVGKTQFIKWLLFTLLSPQAKCGRVIVRCCGGMSDRDSWKKLAVEYQSDAALCALVQQHLTDVCGVEVSFATVDEAFAAWWTTTKTQFGATDAMLPLIILDTCEILIACNAAPKNHTTPRGGVRRQYNALELLAQSLPRDRRNTILAAGCNAVAGDPYIFATEINVQQMDPLTPLTRKGHLEAVERSWQSKIDMELSGVIHELSGGIPRILRQAHVRGLNVTLARGAHGALAECMQEFVRASGNMYCHCQEHLRVVYSCFLASATKFPVSREEPVPLPPPSDEEANLPIYVNRITFDHAVVLSIGAYTRHLNDTLRFVVPPVVVGKLFAEKPWAPICAKNLAPVLDVDMQVKVGQGSCVDRGSPFEKTVVYALYARYLLVWWKSNCASDWVPLADVLEGALTLACSKRIKEMGLEVNISKGVSTVATAYKDVIKKQPNKLIWNCTVQSSHHDAYLSCRQRSSTTSPDEKATYVYAPVPIQCRHGIPKTNTQLAAQLMRRKGTSAKEIEFVLLSVNNNPSLHPNPKIVAADGSQFSSCEWVWLIRPQDPTKMAES